MFFPQIIFKELSTTIFIQNFVEGHPADDEEYLFQQ